MIRSALEKQLGELREELLRLGSLCAEAVYLAVEGLKNRDLDSLERVSVLEEEVDEKAHAVEEQCSTLLATQQPMARDLRSVIAAMVISIDLERFTDHAEGIAVAARRMIQKPPLKPLVDIPRMADVVRDMLDQALTAYVEVDVEAARMVCSRDDVVDQLRHQIMRELLSYMLEDPQHLPCHGSGKGGPAPGTLRRSRY